VTQVINKANSSAAFYERFAVAALLLKSVGAALRK